MQQRRRVAAPSTARIRRGRVGSTGVVHARVLPSPRQLAWLCLRPSSTRSAADAATLATIVQHEPAARGVALAARFAERVRHRSVSHSARPIPRCPAVDRWLKDAGGCGIPAVASFAKGLQQDHAAVRAALTTRWSNGQAEVQITRLKLLKRQMNGRANFDLLRQRVLLVA